MGGYAGFRLHFVSFLSEKVFGGVWGTLFHKNGSPRKFPFKNKKSVPAGRQEHSDTVFSYLSGIGTLPRFRSRLPGVTEPVSQPLLISLFFVLRIYYIIVVHTAQYSILDKDCAVRDNFFIIRDYPISNEPCRYRKKNSRAAAATISGIASVSGFGRYLTRTALSSDFRNLADFRAVETGL